MILTLTLNPALDKVAQVETFDLESANRIQSVTLSPAGKGIDVAKVLRDLNQSVVATGFLGGMVTPLFKEMFEAKGIIDAFIPIAGETRTNLQLFLVNGTRTEFLEPGPMIQQTEREQLSQTLNQYVDHVSVLAICGSAPKGIEPSDVMLAIQPFKEAGIPLIVDSSGPLLKELLNLHPALIKPNQEEMLELMGVSEATEAEMIAFAKTLCAQGIQYVLISLGKVGALLVSKDSAHKGYAPSVPVKSTLGCGDTVVASVCSSLTQHFAPADLLQHAIALSSANAMTVETAHVNPLDYERLLPLVHIEALN